MYISFSMIINKMIYTKRSYLNQDFSLDHLLYLDNTLIKVFHAFLTADN